MVTNRDYIRVKHLGILDSVIAVASLSKACPPQPQTRGSVGHPRLQLAEGHQRFCASHNLLSSQHMIQ